MIIQCGNSVYKSPPPRQERERKMERMDERKRSYNSDEATETQDGSYAMPLLPEANAVYVEGDEFVITMPFSLVLAPLTSRPTKYLLR